ncbi:hypothetical protein [Nonomuraea sp. KM90]|uniref:hypothetical protein n=1 Tax=Nonomuraea sp. KM90 TaxID=3457428 RepID=UPI003FCE986D
MKTAAVRQAETAARNLFDGALPESGTQPRAVYAGEPVTVASWVHDVVDLALGGSRGRLRRVPSAGALYPVDAYVLAEGRLLLHDPVRHALLDRGPGPEEAGAVVLLTLEPSRTIWKYGSRSLPSLLLDLGHAAGSLAAAAACLGLDCRICLEPDARTTADLTGAPYGLAAVHMSTSTKPPPHGAPADDRPLVLSAPADDRAPDLAARALGARPTGFEPGRGGAGHPDDGHRLVLQALDDLSGGDGRWEPSPMSRFVRDVLERRRSTPPPFTGELGAADLRALLNGGLLIAATRHGLATAEGPVGRGDARPTLAAWATGQAFLADAAAILLYTADLADYRSAYTRAGLEVHRALLAAEELGLPARPIGSWGPADLGAALGRRPGTQVIVHGAAVGGRKDHT